MKYFIFRNQTIELLFRGKDYKLSGYDDISIIPVEASNYVWFYQVPIKFDADKLADEIDSYIDKLQLVLSQISEGKMLIVISLSDLLGLHYTEANHTIASAIQHFNEYAWELSIQHGNVKVLDFSSFASQYSQKDLIDWKYYFTSQTLLNPRLAPAFQKWWNSRMEAIEMKRKKCLVLDLDNTLWGGVLGEDGCNGIKIGGDYPGKAFVYFQEALLSLSRHGIILTICSKNNEADVLEALEKNPSMVLRKEHFSAYRINWSNKADNIKELAKELNIGLDSFVFIDDNPTERELIKQVLPMVECPEFPSQPYMLMEFFREIVKNYFYVYTITDEDKKKTEQYKANFAREQAAVSFTDMESYFRSLDMRLTIIPADEHNIPRIAQMTQKTNQFNLTTRRYTDADIRQHLKDGWQIWCLGVADKFGDNGITGCIMVKGNTIDSLLLSCRILGKGIEYAFAKTILGLLRQQRGGFLNATYIPTLKNGQVADFYDKLGFCVLHEENGEKNYTISLNDADIVIENYYQIEVK